MKKIVISFIAGAVLGVVCILGASLRSNEPLGFHYLFAFWFNRVLMGLVLGLIPSLMSKKKDYIKGFFMGLIISFAFYSATNFHDVLGFAVGGVYGIIIIYIQTIFKVS